MKKIYIIISTIFCLFIVGCTKNTKIEKIVSNKSEIILNISEKETIEYELFPEDVSSDVIWSSNNETVAIVNDGEVTAISIGSATITITCAENKKITTSVEVNVVANTYTITYVLDEGIFNEDVVDKYEENVGLPSLPVPSKEGYEFKGWYLEDELVTSIESTINKDVTLVAKWEKLINYYNITYVLDEGIFNEDVVDKYEENKGLETLPVPSKEGYEFKGWYLEDELVTSIESTINKDVTLVAKWEKIIKLYTITYVLNDGYFTQEVVKEYNENEGLETLPTPEKDGYIFLGWFLNGNAIENISANLNKNVILSARWERVQIDIEEEVEKIIKLIDSLPYKTTYADKEKIENIYNQYLALDKDTRTFVTNIDVLNEKIAFIEEIENNKSEITYVLGDDIALSKNELFVNFFSDFYLYIKNNHGTSSLEYQGIRSLEDFVNLAGNYSAGSGSMTQIGYVAGRYMLTKDINGILENQPETGFFGYCYQNNRYVDLLPFFIRFFAYWRIDEGYANTSNYGADTFAESWAPTVDIAKFFYYTNETTYVKTERMLDCFNYTSNVIYGDLPTEIYEGMVLPTNIRLRGYIFDGWYDNPDFTGEKITTITDTSKKVILYAKWVEDTALKDKDDAAMVDVYIYNLTTKQANVSKLTVNYVSEMYQALSYNAKSLVRKYSTLVQYEDKFKDEFLEPVNITITAQIDKDFDIDFIRNSFLNDFNMVTNSSITTFEDFINKRYSYMDELSDFFADRGMYGKWGYLLDILYSDSAAKGLKTQINRIKNNESGDTEYVCKAVANLLLAQNASSDNEILIDYSSNELQNRLVSDFGVFKFIFKTESYLPTINIDGYEFVGFYDSNNNLVTKVLESTNSNLIAVYNKK